MSRANVESPFTRDAYERRRRMVKEVERREGRLLAIVSVGLGLAQLAFIRWADAHLDREPRVALAGGIFLVYMVLVVVLLARLQRRVREVRPRCPECGIALRGMSERVAGATGRCDACGGQVIA